MRKPTIVIGILLALGLTMLAGCSNLKYGECILRDNTSHPCNY